MSGGPLFQKEPAFTRDLTPGFYPGDPKSRTGIQTIPASGGFFGDKDKEFWEALKDQLAEAGADYDVADQPFKSLADVNVGTGRPQPVKMPSMLTTRGIPTGGSYNPYLGDPARRKRVR